MNRKLKKLVKNPRLYFVDLLKKRLAKGTIPTRYMPWAKKVSGNYKYSVVCAVYGVESYIEQFFTSIENQTLDFVEHIELIMVDDGSLDASADIIKKWVSKYPKNIKYINKENGGQASARNLGMTYVSNEWVTFIDPDDFVDNNYFAEVDAFISSEEDMALVSSNLIFYHEDKDKFSDGHPLRYRYRADETILDANDLKDHIQLSASAAFFRTQIIIENNLIMETNIKPTFEDAHFVGKYLLSVFGMKAGFLKSAKYYYRKRMDKSSTLDGSWLNASQYYDKLRYGYLDLLEYAKKTKGEIPEYIQRTVLYECTWYIKHIVNHQEKLSFLSSKEKDEFLALFREIFTHFDEDVIARFNLAGCWFFHKVGMIGSLKGLDIPFQIVYVEDYDPIKNLVQLKYYYHGVTPLELIEIDDQDVTPVFNKSRIHDFLGDIFVNERILWVPLKLKKDQGILSISIGDIKTRLSFAGKHHFNGVVSENIVNHFSRRELNSSTFPSSVQYLRKESRTVDTTSKYSKAWLLMDRDIQADDNAEHLYRYIHKHHPNINAHFVLRNTSHDWGRLKKEGFLLIDFDSHEHKLALLNADHVVSSHADEYVWSLLENKWYSDLLSFKYTFLQHGIIQNDMSNWLNSKPMSIFVTSTQQEFNSIAEGINRYKFSSKEVSLTGLPRHDALLKLNEDITTDKLVVIMPTWRQGIVGEVIGQGNDREVNDAFYLSDYAQAWKSFLHSVELKEKVTTTGFKVVFFPHANIKPYLDWFETPEYIEIISHDSISSMQDLFCRSAIMITDYSSVAFEMAYLKKSIIYYQFDYDYVFGGGHLTSKGYFDYGRDGFGPVCETEDETLSVLSKMLHSDGELEKAYSDRIDATFVRRDGLCCQRVYQAISQLNNYDEKNKKGVISLEYAQKATDNKYWEVSSNRWELIYANSKPNSSELFEAGLQAVRANRCDGKIGSTRIWLECLSKICSESINAKCYWKIKLEWAHLWMASQEWDKALEYLNEVILSIDIGARVDPIFYKIECLGYLKRWDDIKNEVDMLKELQLSDAEQSLVLGWALVAVHKLGEAIEIWNTVAEDDRNLVYCHAQLFVSYTNKNDSETVNYLERIKVLTNSSRPVLLDTRVGVTQSAYISFSNKWAMDFDERPAIDMSCLIKAFRQVNQATKANELLKKALRLFPEDKNILIEKAELSFVDGDIEENIKQWELLLEAFGDDFMVYKLAGAYQKKGLIDKAAALLFDDSTSIIVKPKKNSDWVLLTQLANQIDNKIALRDFVCAQ